MPDFGAPLLLPLLLAAPAAAALLALRAAGQRRAVRRFLGDAAGEREPLLRRARLALAAAALLAAVALLGVAAARPQWGSQPNPMVRRGADVVIVLDASLSMAATDLEPNRMAYAQEQLVRALDQLQGDRVGLVLFGADARLRFPLTTDTAAAAQVIRLTQPGDRLVGQGTAIGPALTEAARAFDGEDERSRGRAVVLVTDGENLTSQGTPPVDELTRRDAVLYTVGAGTREGSRIPVPGEDGETAYKVDTETGEPVVTRLNERFLQDLAAAGDGRYYRLGPGDDLSGLVADLNGLESAQLDEGEANVPVERFQWALAAALALLGLETLLARPPAGWRMALRGRRTRTAVPLLLMAAALAAVAVSCDRPVESLNADGNRMYLDGESEDALETYQKAQLERPDLAELHYNAGNALHRLRRYDRAAEETRRALSAGDPEIRFRAYYALGNHYYREGRFADAYEAYKSALKENPSDRDAKVNLELAFERLQAQRSQGQEGGQPGGNTPPPEGPPQPGEQPQPGPSTDGEPGTAPPEDEDGAVRDAIRRFEEGGNIEDAIRVLDALRERQRRGEQEAGPSPDTAGTRDW